MNYYVIGKTGEYLVKISDSDGCIGYERFEVGICPTPLWAPNTFTPNTDNLNEGFRAYKDQVYSFEIEIYDRWNKIMFKSNDITEGWNGNVNNEEGRVCAQGLYIWKIKFKEIENNQSQIVIGEVNLLR